MLILPCGLSFRSVLMMLIMTGVTVQSSSGHAEFKRGSFERLQAHYRVGVMVGDDKNCILEAIKVEIKSVEV